MKFCSQCGATLAVRIPVDDNRLRHICDQCGTVHYINPKIVAGCIPVYEDRVLLCKRAIEPRPGYWTLPGGFMEMDETSLEAAIRETREEANARVEVIELYNVFNLPHVNQVYIMYRARLLDLDFHPGEESLETKLFTEQEIPWDNIAFTTIRQTLKFYFQDRQTDNFRFHSGDIIREADRYFFRSRPALDN